MPRDESPQGLQRIREYRWYPLLPLVGLLLLYHFFMPATGSPTVWDLAMHQQVIAFSAFPTFIVTMYWFAKANGLDERKTPEERILNDE